MVSWNADLVPWIIEFECHASSELLNCFADPCLFFSSSYQHLEKKPYFIEHLGFKDFVVLRYLHLQSFKVSWLLGRFACPAYCFRGVKVDIWS